ncbi:PTS transporter subunit IIC, partial [Bacillus altitudinis]|uniref:PTS transporter subunit IIC n=1 Tax=Bacillus altitudinis TaxID=293387 RepID=UPI00307E1A7E
MVGIIMRLLGMILREGFKKWLGGGIRMGIGFVGVNVVINLVVRGVGGGGKGMVNCVGLKVD